MRNLNQSVLILNYVFFFKGKDGAHLYKRLEWRALTKSNSYNILRGQYINRISDKISFYNGIPDVSEQVGK